MFPRGFWESDGLNPAYSTMLEISITLPRPEIHRVVKRESP